MGLFNNLITPPASADFISNTVWNGKKTTYVLQSYVTRVTATTAPGKTNPWSYRLGGGAFTGGERDSIYKATNIPQGSYRFLTDEQLGDWPIWAEVRYTDPNRDVRQWDLWPNWGTKPPKTFVSAIFMPQGQSLYPNNWDTSSLKAIDGNLSANIFRNKYILINSAFPNYAGVATPYNSFYNYFFRTDGCVDASKVTAKKIINSNLNQISTAYIPFPARNDPNPWVKGPRFYLGGRTDDYGLLAIPIDSIKQIPFGKKIRYQFDTQWIHCRITSKLVLVQYEENHEYSNLKHTCKGKPAPAPIPQTGPNVPLVPCQNGCWDVGNGIVAPCRDVGYASPLPKGFKYAWYKLFPSFDGPGCPGPYSSNPSPIATPNVGLNVDPYPMEAGAPGLNNNKYWFDFQTPITNAKKLDYINFQNLSLTSDKEAVYIAKEVIPRPIEANDLIK